MYSKRNEGIIQYAPRLRFPEHFKVMGVSFAKADTSVRSRFAMTSDQISQLYQKAIKLGFSDLLILSTCNRLEFYAMDSNAQLENLITNQLQLTRRDWDLYFTKVQGMKAARHFFSVVSGLDSQIIGDYEIVGQVKTSIDKAREYKLIGTILDRVSNIAFQSSKKIKAQTNISHGKYSVSHAAAELIKSHHPGDDASILIVGTGSFGSTVAKNLRQYFPHARLTLTNRTLDKAKHQATLLNAKVLPFDEFCYSLHTYDAVVTTTGADNYLIYPHHIRPSGCKLFLDLSVPQAIDPHVNNIDSVKVYSVDEVSAFHNKILKRRYLDLPLAWQILDEHLIRLSEWQNIYQHSAIVSAYKKKAHYLLSDKAITNETKNSKRIDRTFSGLMRQIRYDGFVGCHFIEAMNNLVSEDK